MELRQVQEHKKKAHHQVPKSRFGFRKPKRYRSGIMKNLNKIFISAIGTVLLLLGSTVPTWAKDQVVNGAIEVEGKKKLRNVIVYLVPADLSALKLQARKHKVTQKGRKFDPPLLVISLGDSVQWLNDEEKEIDHNIYSLSKAKTFDLGLGEKGSILEQGFKAGGNVVYFCSVHKTMDGRVVILPTRFYAVLKKPGSFILPNIPAGTWTLSAVVFHRRFKAEPVNISLGKDPVKDVVLKISRR